MADSDLRMEDNNTCPQPIMMANLDIRSENNTHEQIQDEHTTMFSEENYESTSSMDTGKKYYECEQCGKTFQSKAFRQRHMEEIHEGIRYPCEECNYIATRKTHLKNHIKSEHNGVRFSCSECNYEAKSKQTLNRHVASVHAKIRYPCSYCYYRAKQPHALKKHIEVIHKNEISGEDEAVEKGDVVVECDVLVE